MVANHMLIADEDFSNIENVLIGDVNPTQGFPSCNADNIL